MDDLTPIVCKYCKKLVRDCFDEALKCTSCSEYVHVKCLRRGAVPGGLNGDVFFSFVCSDCTEGTEVFERDKISWLQVIILILYHLNTKSPGLARKGFFHWRYHVATFIDKNWEVLFTKNVKKKKSWTGTVAGTLSHFSIFFFLSGTSVFKEQAWWTLKYPKMSPSLSSKIYNALSAEKQQLKSKKLLVSEIDLFNEILERLVDDKDLLSPFALPTPDLLTNNETDFIKKDINAKESNHKRKNILPNFEMKKILKLNNVIDPLMDEVPNVYKMDTRIYRSSEESKNKSNEDKKQYKLLDPYCHYNTSLNNISRLRGETMQVKLMGNIRKEMILSPFSGMYLKPYIRRDTRVFPAWLRLMAELQIKVNCKNADYVLPPRGPLDYTYVQPEHIPAVNSLCNQFFWPGIDMTESLQYPDFSCVVLYKKLIVAFAFIVPSVSHTENYLSFIFTRPGWRDVGIAKFMLYHLIQTSLGKDIILHVSINSTALLLYQKFGFKVESVVLDFYDQYIRSGVMESKHAFLCRLERSSRPF